MTKIIKLVLLSLTLTLSFSLFACTITIDICNHKDNDSDYVCDKCGAELKKEEEEEEEETYTASLVTDGAVNFQIIYAKNAPADARQAVNNNIIKPFKEQNLTVNQITEGTKEDVAQDCEILIGDITNRDTKYQTKSHSFGSDGYTIKLIDSKVIINAGSASSLVTAIEVFAETVLGYGIEDFDLTDITMSSEQNKELIQTDYKITSISVRRTNIKDYTIATDTSNATYKAAAEDLQYMLYDRAGLWLEIVPLASATDKSIVIKHIDKVYTDDSFKIYTTAGGQLVVECAFDNMLEDTLSEFITNNITTASGNVVFNGTVMKKDISTVYYEDFGAKGDGKTDDFVAIFNTHVFANEGGQRVMADSTKTYYIHKTHINRNATSIPIKTDVEWGTAKFIIDDSDIDPRNPNYSMMYNWHIFTVVSDYEPETIGVPYGTPVDAHKEILDNIMANGGIKPGTTKIDLGYVQGDYPVMIFPNNYGHRVFRRSGPYTPESDGVMRELIVLDKEGNVSPETPIMFDYTTLQCVEVYRIDDAPITVNGGIFTTVAYELNSKDQDGKEYVSYFKRGIRVNRSNTTVQNVEHYMTNEVTLREQALEGKFGPAYNGFYYVDYASNVLFKDCIMTAKRKFGSGTYEIAAGYANKVVFDGCVQTNFWIKIDEDYNVLNAYEGEEGAMPNYGFHFLVEGVDVMYVLWGCGGTNYCKNVEYIRSRLSRYDAHQGLYNGKIIDSEVSGIEITGYGDMIIENSRVFSNSSNSTFNSLIHLRGDYGYIWQGDITIKDTDVYFYTDEDGRNSYVTPYLFNNGWSNWYYGYTTYSPNAIIDNLDLLDMLKITPKHDNGTPLPVGAPISSETLKAERIEEGFEVDLYTLPAPRAHLENTGTYPAQIQLTDRDENGTHYDLSKASQRAQYLALLAKYNSLSDEEKATYTGLDGWVDDPRDRTKPLLVNGQPISYLEKFDEMWQKEQSGALGSGGYYRYLIQGDSTNYNIKYPPQYIKILNNDGVEGLGGYKFVMKRTAGQGIPSGEYYGITENGGGYFGCTTFYYDGGSFVGTALDVSDSPFVFE